MRKATATIGLCLGLLGGLFACGGDDEGDTTSSTSGSGTGGGASSSATTATSASSSATTSGSTSSASSGGGGGGGSGSRRVFATSATYAGDLGGIAGADAKCQALADGAGLGGTWLAWLSDLGTSPGARFVHSTVPYALVGGSTIASDWTDLTDGTIAVPIDHDETGTALPAAETTRVWSGTDAAGAPIGGNCSEWTLAGGGGTYGSTTATDATWAFTTGNGCDNLNRLYCFEE